MKRLAMILAVSLVASLVVAGCGGSSGPSVSQVTITVSISGVPQVDVPVVESSDFVAEAPAGTTYATQNTDVNGKTTFSVPSSTPTGNLCFTAMIMGGHISECRTLNALEANQSLSF